MSIVNFTEWSAFLTSYPEAHILQSASWGKLKGQFGWEAVHFINGTTGAQVLIRQLPMRQKMAYIPMGPVGEDWAALLVEIDEYCLRNRIFMLKIEPDGLDPLEVAIKVPGFISSRQTIQPRRSIIIDLSSDNETLLAHMKQKTRYNIGLAAKKGVTVKAWEDLPGFHRMMEMTGERDTFGIHSVDYYQQAYELFHSQGACELLAAFHEGEVLAALMVFAAGRRAWYFYGASGNQKRYLMPAYLLQWQAMLWAKNKGCTHYDMWGVPDQEEEYLEEHFNNHREGLWGVYRFKRGFGGSLVRSAGAFDRVYLKDVYSLYTLYIRMFKRIE
jgi:lipid II:glycine glycyltransferase (peptidoglycan interpeptide bridge formation enzyme)